MKPDERTIEWLHDNGYEIVPFNVFWELIGYLTVNVGKGTKLHEYLTILLDGRGPQI